MKHFLFLFLSFTGTTSLLAQPQSSVYRDVNESYNRGLHFYEEGLYGKAREEFALFLEQVRNIERFKEATHVAEARLYDGMAALRLQRPDGERLLLDFIADYQPSAVANKAIEEIGDFYYAEGQYKKSLEYFEKIDDRSLSNAKLAELTFKKGYAAFVLKDFNQSIRHFDKIKSLESDANYPHTNYYHATASFFQGNNDQALAGYKVAEKNNGYKKIVPYNITQIYFAKRQFKELIGYAEPLYKNDKSLLNRVDIGQLIGQSYYELGDYNTALTYFEAYVAAKPKVSKDILYQLAVLQMNKKDYKSAVNNFSELTNVEGDMATNARYNLAVCYVNQSKKQDAYMIFKALDKSKLSESMAEDVKFNQGKLAAELGAESEAIELLQEIPNTSKYYGESQVLLSDLFLNSKDYARALKLIRELKTKTPKIKEAYQKVAFYQGVETYRTGNKADADKLFAESLNNPIDPSLASQAYFWRAEIAYASKNYDVAITRYISSVKYNQDVPDVPENTSMAAANYGIGYSYFMEKKYDNAATYFEKTVANIMKNKSKYKDLYLTKYVYPDAILHIGDCQLAQKKYTQALASYNTVVNNNYDNKPYAIYQIGVIEGLKNNPSGKLSSLEKIIKDYPESSFAENAYLDLGQVYLETNNTSEAINKLNTFVQTYPSSPRLSEALNLLGLAYTRQNNKEKAIEYYKRTIIINPKSSNAEVALKQIKEIYANSGQSDKYFTFVESVTGEKTSEAEREDLEYRVIANNATDADAGNIVAKTTLFLKKYPQSKERLNVLRYRGEAYQRLNRPNEAIDDFEEILKTPNSTVENSARINLGEIYAKTQNQPKALIQYDYLHTNSKNPNNKLTYALNAAKLASQTNAYEKLPTYLNTIFTSKAVQGPEVLAEAYFYQAKMQNANKQYDESLKSLNKLNEVWSKPHDNSGEAYYLKAQNYYMKRELKTAGLLCDQAHKVITREADGIWGLWCTALRADIYVEENVVKKADMLYDIVLSNLEESDTTGLFKSVTEKSKKVKNALKITNKVEQPNNSEKLELQDRD